MSAAQPTRVRQVIQRTREETDMIRRTVDAYLRWPPPPIVGTSGVAYDLFRANVLAYVEEYKCLPENVAKLCAARAAEGQRVAW